jgi:Domain of unknown function (DUF4383)
MHNAEATSRFFRTPVQVVAVVIAYVFLLIGVLGFVPGITTNYGQLTIVGHHSKAELFGVFNVSALHNVLHLTFGAAGIMLSRTFSPARRYLVAGGTVYLLLFVYGLVVPHDSVANVLPVNDADTWLHLGLGAVMITLGVTLGGIGGGSDRCIRGAGGRAGRGAPGRDDPSD